jgi:hypothetical protein
MGLAAVGHHRVVGPITAGGLIFVSDRIGKQWKRLSKPFGRQSGIPITPSPFKIVKS